MLLCSGDTGPGIQSWVHSASAGRFEYTLGQQGIICLFPTARKRPYTLAGGQLSNVWHDRTELSFSALPNAADAEASARQVEALIQEVAADGIPAFKVVSTALTTASTFHIV
jgi:hypothetical protein